MTSQELTSVSEDSSESDSSISSLSSTEPSLPNYRKIYVAPLPSQNDSSTIGTRSESDLCLTDAYVLAEKIIPQYSRNQRKKHLSASMNSTQSISDFFPLAIGHSPMSSVANSIEPASSSYQSDSCFTPQPIPTYSKLYDSSSTSDDSITSSRMTSSVATEDDATKGSSVPKSSPRLSRQQPPHSSVNKKTRRIRAPSSTSSQTSASPNSSSSSGISIDFTANIRDHKSGKLHPLHIVAKYLDGYPSRVYINGKAFAPCDDE